MERPDFFTLKNGDKAKLPFSEKEYQRRVNNLRVIMSKNNLDMIILTSMHNIAYYTGFIYCSFGRPYGCVITANKISTISANIDASQPLPITDERMTRFMVTLDQAVNLVWDALDDMVGGEIYVKKIPSMSILDIAASIRPNFKYKIIGIRPGEKLHEQMIGTDDAPFTYEYAPYYKILPAINGWHNDSKRIKTGKLVERGFSYTSDNNTDWMSINTLSDWIKNNMDKMLKI